MQCPYCKKEMVSGKIYGDRYQMKWMPDDKKLFLGIWARDFLPIGEGFQFIGRPTANAYVCLGCKKLIHDLEI